VASAAPRPPRSTAPGVAGPLPPTKVLPLDLRGQAKRTDFHIGPRGLGYSAKRDAPQRAERLVLRRD
ncbi:unnamed protein product, partial [Prorocentrum cordatum]